MYVYVCAYRFFFSLYNCIYVYLYMYVYVCAYRFFFSLYNCIYVHIFVCMCMRMCLQILLFSL